MRNTAKRLASKLARKSFGASSIWRCQRNEITGWIPLTLSVIKPLLFDRRHTWYVTPLNRFSESIDCGHDPVNLGSTTRLYGVNSAPGNAGSAELLERITFP